MNKNSCCIIEYNMNGINDMVVVKTDEGYSVGGFKIDSCLYHMNNYSQNEQKGGKIMSKLPLYELAVPAGIAHISTNELVHPAIHKAVQDSKSRKVIDEDTFNALFEAIKVTNKIKKPKYTRRKQSISNKHTRKIHV